MQGIGISQKINIKLCAAIETPLIQNPFRRVHVMVLRLAPTDSGMAVLFLFDNMMGDFVNHTFTDTKEDAKCLQGIAPATIGSLIFDKKYK